MGWNNHVIESVELISGNSCETDPGYIPPPILVKPLNNAVVYGPTSPELCWQMQGGTQGYVYNALIYNDTGSWESGWISESCWMADSILGVYGNYSWSVQAKNSGGDLSQWSLINSFNYIPDTIAPTITILSPLQNSTVHWPKANIIVNPVENETSVARVYFFAWYDDGITGYDWWTLGLDEDPSDGWRYVWNLTIVQSPDAAVAVYAEDQAGNFGNAMVSGITVERTMVNNNGYQPRGSKPDSSSIDNPPIVLPAGLILPPPLVNENSTQESGSSVTVQPKIREYYWKSLADVMRKKHP